MRTLLIIAFVVLCAIMVTLFRVILCALGSVIYLYLLPGIIAAKRGHPRARDLYLICAFGGWLVLPWAGALWLATRTSDERALMVDAPLALHATEE